MIGVYKNGNVIWDSGPIIKPGVNEDIWGTMDLNDDGYVEIIASFYYGMKNSSQSIWIYSWDGQNGSLLNEVQSEGSLNNSVIFSFDWFTDVFDIDGDGILEIKGQDEETRETKIYSWNGSKYGDYGASVPEYVPMNLLTAKVSCKVEESQYGLLFNYTVKNDSMSKQPVWRFAVEKMFDLVYDFDAPNKWQGSYSHNWDILKWGIISDSKFYPYNFIQPGNHLDSMTFVTDSILPHITSYYIQGKNGDSFSDDQFIFENSFKGVTICGKYPPDPFIPSDFIDTLLNYNQRSLELGWIINQATADKYDSLFNSAKTQLQQNNNNAARATLQTVLQEVDLDSTGSLTSEAYALLKYNTEYLLENIPQSSPYLTVSLKSSTGTLLTTGSLQYYEGGWKDAINNGDGTFTVVTNLSQVSLRMEYEYASQTVSNIPAQNNTYTFQTVNAAVELRNSLGNLIDEGTVQYYAGGWRSFGTTVNGVANKELLPINYSFRMTYAYASIDKQQNLSVNPTVVFQTVNAAVELRNSLGNLMDEGTVQYYAGAWRTFGTTTNGVATKELLPINYSFRMTYEYASIDKQQNLSSDPTVVFQTVNAAVQLKNSLGNLIDVGTVQYYAGAWRTFGTTTNGVATKELLPINYSFRMTYEYASIDKQQNLSVDPTVVFQTVNAAVQLKNSLGNLIDQGTVQYYAGAWRSFGTTSNGVAYKELLPINYSFRMTYEFASIDKQQNLSVDPTIIFQTVNAAVQLKNSLGNLIDVGTVQYYAGAWRSFGTTTNGVAYKELLPLNYSFRMTYEYLSKDKQQNLSSNSVVDFTTVLCTVKVSNTNNQPLENADVKYYGGAWRDIGLTNTSGIITKELLPLNISFRASYGNVSQDKQQDIGANNLVEIQLNVP